LNYQAAALRLISIGGYLERVVSLAPDECRRTRATTFEQTMGASRPIPGTPRRRVRLLPKSRLDALKPGDAKRFREALACVFAGYALAWVEIPLQLAVPPSEATTASPLAAAIIARVLLGVLYMFVALRFAWARWTVVALGFLSALFVVPMLPGEWQVFPLAAFVTGLGVVCKLTAAILLMLPLRARQLAP
jgi:hypothetical protein